MSIARDRKRPTQAVILAGGRGTRLQPITLERPKPMVEVCGRPFMEYLVEQLHDQGFERILMLLGYLPEVIQDHFRDGSDWGLKIEYAVTGADTLTSRRVELAKDRIEDCFLLMYCDNYWPMRIDRMWELFLAHDVPAMVTVYSNKDNYTGNSLKVGRDGYVEVYDRTRKGPGLAGVEIGYSILTRETLELLPKEEALLEEAIYPPLIREHKLLAYVTDHRYYSVGGLQRLPTTEKFFAQGPTVILDRDGVLNRKPPRAQYVKTWSEFEWLPGAKQALRSLHEKGYRVVVVSNQAGINRGFMTAADLAVLHQAMQHDVAAAGGNIAAIYHCPHDWNEGCECRKPSPGMLFQAQRDFDLNLRRTPFIGDDERDGMAAEAAGCPFLRVGEGRSLLDCVQQLIAKDSAVEASYEQRRAECRSAYS